ncbi:MAG: GNAT family N-acetyltransferase [Nitrososphaeria archaeon]
MLVFKNQIISIRGSLDAAEPLLDRIDLDDVEANCCEEHKLILLKKYEPTMEHKMTLMKLEKVADGVRPKYPLTKLGTDDAEETTKIIRESLPIHWSQVTTEEIYSRINEGDPCYCIKEDCRIVSIALAREKDFGETIGIVGSINTVATIKDYRNRGYATSMVSQLSRKLLERSKYVLLFVLSDNIPAFKAYSRVGFKPVRSYYFMRGHKIMG